VGQKLRRGNKQKRTLGGVWAAALGKKRGAESRLDPKKDIIQKRLPRGSEKKRKRIRNGRSRGIGGNRGTQNHLYSVQNRGECRFHDLS